MRLSNGDYRSRNRDLKIFYTCVNNALRFVELQDLRAGLLLFILD